LWYPLEVEQMGELPFLAYYFAFLIPPLHSRSDNHHQLFLYNIKIIVRAIKRI
jgi:hypothetical protein